MRCLAGFAVFVWMFFFSVTVLGQPCPPVDVNLAVAEQVQTWWMVLLDFLLQLVMPLAIAVLTTLTGVAIRKWGKKLDVDNQEAIIRVTDGIITSGLSFAEEQGRKALRAGSVRTTGADKLQSAVNYAKHQIEASGLPRIAENELIDLIEAKLHQERVRPNGVIAGDGGVVNIDDVLETVQDNDETQAQGLKHTTT